MSPAQWYRLWSEHFSHVLIPKVINDLDMVLLIV